ncbi:hypothetical protein EG68_08291 [Paragonimus skrjabini miyazakii]|uniref:EF-hand domain-containing protein n=1 Tax=Paragonimus skrjabini miyazakii TaxID=59628 RepID=A0A8S9YQA2_9TREM|nr:hypothetical protein EG68_08291 [Paragonimus skrjabini miyazakii]
MLCLLISFCILTGALSVPVIPKRPTAEELKLDLKENYQKYQEHLAKLQLKLLKEHKLAKPENRKILLEKFTEQLNRIRQHEPISEPGTDAHFKKVWHDGDQLDEDTYDPTLFFQTHDYDNNARLDAHELDTTFENLLDQLPAVKADTDMELRELERIRMRNHILNRLDKNKDGLLSLDEFRMRDPVDDGWIPLQDQQQLPPLEGKTNDSYLLDLVRKNLLEHPDEAINEEIMHDLTGMQANVQEKPILFQVPPHVDSSHEVPATTTQLPSTTQPPIAAET